MLNISKFKVNTNCLLLCLLILIMGISAGIFFSIIIPSSEKMYLISFLNNSAVNFPHVLFTNIAVLLLILFAGFTIYGFPLALLMLFSRSFAVGFCDCLLLYNMDSGSIPEFVFTFLLPQLILCFIYFAASGLSISYALSRLQNKTHR